MTQFDICLEMAGICLPDGRPLSMFIDRVDEEGVFAHNINCRVFFKNGCYIFYGYEYIGFNGGTSKIPNNIFGTHRNRARELYKLLADIYIED